MLIADAIFGIYVLAAISGWLAKVQAGINSAALPLFALRALVVRLTLVPFPSDDSES